MKTKLYDTEIMDVQELFQLTEIKIKLDFLNVKIKNQVLKDNVL